MSKRVCCALTALVALAAMLLATATAQASPVTVHLRFHRLGRSAAAIITDGRYTLIEPRGSGGPTLLDERTGRRVVLSPCARQSYWHGLPTAGFIGGYYEWPTCGESAVNAPPMLQLYSLAGGTRSVMPIADVSNCYTNTNPDYPCTERPGPAGTDWYVVYGYGRCGCTGVSFVNRQTGQVASPPQGPVNLDSPSLTGSVCAGLTHGEDPDALVFGGDLGFTGSGVGVSDDELGVFQSSGAWLGGLAISYRAYDNHLLSCSGLDRRLYGDGLTGNARALILFNYGDTELHGLFLHGLQRFVVPLPSSLRTELHRHFPTFVLSNRRLWVLGRAGAIWSAPTP